ncbi:MAG: acetamidase/formamidase family protein [Phototrophicaceae bacterium]
MTIHSIEPIDGNVHGYFSKDIVPILTIDSGDTLHVKTLDAGWGLEAPKLDRSPRKKLANPVPNMRGHALCGTVAINGAKAGMTLEINIGDIVTGDYGFTYAGGFGHPIHQSLGLDTGEQALLLWGLDNKTKTARNQMGHKIKINPFMGVMGMPPPEEGQHDTAPPRIWGGNIDCKELVSGTTLYLPIPVDKALFSVGDGHAAQGDGEVSVQAIECPIEKAELTLTLHEDMPLDAPIARIDGAWLTFGFHENLNQAAYMALDNMVNLMTEKLHLSRKEALALASPIVDLRITQIANPAVGVHAILRDDALL